MLNYFMFAAVLASITPFKVYETVFSKFCKCRKVKPKVPKVSDGCYAWSHYGGGCEKCKTNWNECKCFKEETGCEHCMRYLSDCICSEEKND